MSSDLPLALTELRRGVAFGFYARNGVLGSPWAKKEIGRMCELGVRWIVLCPTVMQESYCSTRQYRDFEMTPDDGELRDLIDFCHSRRIRVQLRPMLETQDGEGRLSIWFPQDRERVPGRSVSFWADWFKSMVQRSQHYARIAQETGCECYGLDSELDQTVFQHDHWKRVIESVRKVYDGPVTSCHTFLKFDFEEQLRNPNHWWYDLDLLETSAYHASADRTGVGIEDRVEFLQPQLQAYRRIAEMYGKPIVFGECGCTSSSGGGQWPSSWAGNGKYDGQEQADHLEAIFRAFWSEPWWLGMFWWKWDEQNHRPQFTNDPTGDKGFTIYNKPAADVLKTWFARTDRK